MKTLLLHIRILATLVLRETRASFGTSSVGYLWAIVTPAMSVGLLVFIFSLVDRQPPFGTSLAVFFATGILTIEFFNKLSNTLLTSFSANRALLNYPLIKEADTLYARTLLISATYVMIMLIFFGSLFFADAGVMPQNPHMVFQAFAATMLLGFAIGTLNAVIASLWHSWPQIEKVLTRPLIFVSGVFYLPSRLPTEAQNVLYWNPVLHCVEWFREGFYGNYNSAIFDPYYPIAVSLGILLFGLAGERFTRKSRSMA
ncbi:ABC transporter permease [Shimia marina]|uniref:Transport permease protein n=1 Tax=Shimia marina TaxID=321267 RepID=A0A0P1F9J2_9RHOB|nr:ABC transporter permease [Shimia marina]CUH52130.1 Polysialic acid transport protein KpsM [Shimia marina]SFE64580.1 capsular polysaccharide transport system permease protein [Shimia marina]